ncbi:MAG: hypothetical protein DMG24_16405 [Acidobacteria bacterium]|nr:MAG: hypothetical protein DMG24_16405 [Acidobacteriota bacterium]
MDEWLSRLGQSETLRRNFWDLLSIAALNEDPRIASASLFDRVLRLALLTSPEDSRLGLAVTGLSDCYTHAARDYIRARGGTVETGRSVSSFLISPGRGGPLLPSRSASPWEPISHGRGGPLRPSRSPSPGELISHGSSASPREQREPACPRGVGVCEGVKLADGEEIEAGTVLSAVPCFQFVELLPGDVLRSEPFFERILTLQPAPIISINLWFDRPVTDLDFAGLRGTSVQWLFNKGQILEGAPGRLKEAGRTTGAAAPGWKGYVSLVVSGARAHIERSREDLQELALRELRELLPRAREAKLVHALVIKERFATFSPRADAEDARPEALTPVRGLYLAGDWTSTGLPATIEGAVKSGYTAAEAILDGG